MPTGGLFEGMDWRVAPCPFPLGPDLVRELEGLGRILLQFYRAADLLYRQSAVGKQPPWVAHWLDRGKPADLIRIQQSHALRRELPRVLRPDLLLTDDGFAITELDSVPGGIGLTAWLNQTYAALETSATEAHASLPDAPAHAAAGPSRSPAASIVGGPTGMLDGFAAIFGAAPRVHIVVADESATYRPEMQWLAARLDARRFGVRDPGFDAFAPGDAVYRFFELFDLANLPAAPRLMTMALERQIQLTAPPKAFLEEKMLLGLLWNRHLRGFWHRELGASFFERLLRRVPYTWIVDPAPLPPHGAIPELGLTDWSQLQTLSQRERDLVLKVSGFSPEAWGSRGVYLGSDLSSADWAAAVRQAMAGFDRSPYVLQRYHKPRLVDTLEWDAPGGRLVRRPARVRLCPYYFVVGDGDAARTRLGGVLATLCGADKKIIHGMTDATLAPCGA
jgi:hypothetical protein